MNFNDIPGLLANVCRLAALGLAIAAGLKLFGLMTFRPGTMEMAAVAIALALVSK